MPNNPNGTPIFDSKEYRWSDMSFEFLNVNIVAIQELTYSVEQDSEELFAAGDEPISIQRGNRKYSGQMTILKSLLDDMNTAAQAAGFRDVLDLNFPVTVAYSNTTKVKKDVLVGCVITKFNDGMSQGDKYAKIVLPFKFTRRKPIQ